MLPVGTIIHYLKGYFDSSDNTGYHNLMGSVSDINNELINWRVCDGSQFYDPQSPIWNVPSRHLPNLSNNRFLASSIMFIGIAGGSTTRVPEGSIQGIFTQNHLHSINHSHNIDHTHSFSHLHSMSEHSHSGSSNCQITTNARFTYPAHCHLAGSNDLSSNTHSHTFFDAPPHSHQQRMIPSGSSPGRYNGRQSGAAGHVFDVVDQYNWNIPESSATAALSSPSSSAPFYEEFPHTHSLFGQIGIFDAAASPPSVLGDSDFSLPLVTGAQLNNQSTSTTNIYTNSNTEVAGMTNSTTSSINYLGSSQNSLVTVDGSQFNFIGDEMSSEPQYLGVIFLIKVKE